MDDAHFRRYHVLMGEARILGRKARFYPLWKGGLRDLIYEGRWAVYERDSLERRFGSRWPEMLATELGKSFLTIEGEDETGDRHLLPRQELQQSRGRTAGLGMDTLVRHLKAREGLRSYDDILSVLERSATPWILEWLADAGSEARNRRYQRSRLRKAYSNGKASHSSPHPSCPYCPPNRLPLPLRDLVMDYVSPS